MIKNIEWILFDFGGCLDSDGIHSRSLFFNKFLESGLVNMAQSHAHFQEAYSFADKMITEHSLVTNSTLLEMNEVMCSLIVEKLNIHSHHQTMKIALAITEVQSFFLKRNNKILEELQNHFRLGIISNFSGNLKKIISEFSLSEYFEFILDSYDVGFSKPNLEIFKTALVHCKTTTDKICFVGDNIDRDILPAKSLGMRTILISQNQIVSPADMTLLSLEEIFRQPSFA